jgi:hypothetical protein
MIELSPADKAILELGELFKSNSNHKAVKALLDYADQMVDSALNQKNPSLEWNMGYAAAMRDLTKYPERCIYNMDTILKHQVEMENEKRTVARTAPQTV